MPRITVSASSHNHGHNPKASVSHHNPSRSNGLFVTPIIRSQYHYRPAPSALIIFFLLAGLFIGCAFLTSSLTIAMTASSVTGSALLGTAMMSISASTLVTGIGLLAYITAGIISSVYAGIETYNSLKSWQEALKDVVYCNRYLDDKRSITSIATAVAVVLMSPFLLIGSFSGLGVKACINAYQHRQTAPLAKTQDDTIGSYNSSSLQNILNTPNPSDKTKHTNQATQQPMPYKKSQSTYRNDQNDSENKNTHGL